MDMPKTDRLKPVFSGEANGNVGEDEQAGGGQAAFTRPSVQRKKHQIGSPLLWPENGRGLLLRR